MKAVIVTIWATIYLLIFYAICAYFSSPVLNGLLYLSAPVVLITMVILILKDDSIKSKELGENEWGYADKNKDDLWIM